MKLSSSQYAQALYEAVTQTDSKDHDLVMDRFVKILAANGDLGKHQEIENEYKRLDMAAKGIKEAEVTVAREMEVNHQIIDDLNKIINGNVGASFSRPQSETGGQGRPLQMEIKKKIDEGIVGGVIVKVDDTLIDASLKTQLNNLNNQLKQ